MSAMTLMMPRPSSSSLFGGIFGRGPAQPTESEARQIVLDTIGERYQMGKVFAQAQALEDCVGDGFPISESGLRGIQTLNEALRAWARLDMDRQRPITTATNRALSEGRLRADDVPVALRDTAMGGWYRGEDQPPGGLGFEPISLTTAALIVAGMAIAAGVIVAWKQINASAAVAADDIRQKNALMNSTYAEANAWRRSRGQEPRIFNAPNGPQSDFGDTALKAGGGALLAVGAVLLGLWAFNRKRGA